MMIEPHSSERPRRSAFDRIGVLALVWAAVFLAVSAGLAFAYG
jgi:hypothetical protein